MGWLRSMYAGGHHATFGWRREREAREADGARDRAVSERRSEAMRSFFPKLAIWINNRIHFSRMREIEAYLSQATDLVDLEHRIAKIERSASWH